MMAGAEKTSTASIWCVVVDAVVAVTISIFLLIYADYVKPGIIVMCKHSSHNLICFSLNQNPTRFSHSSCKDCYIGSVMCKRVFSCFRILTSKYCVLFYTTFGSVELKKAPLFLFQYQTVLLGFFTGGGGFFSDL
jgi:hypothetical protein